MEDEYSTVQSSLARRMHQGCTGPPPPSLHSYIGWLRNFRFLNFAKFLISNFAKLEENFAKHEIKNFAATLLLHNLPSATQPPLQSARIFFNVARQCYFEMKMNTELYFSILSSIILWMNSSYYPNPSGAK